MPAWRIFGSRSAVLSIRDLGAGHESFCVCREFRADPAPVVDAVEANDGAGLSWPVAGRLIGGGVWLGSIRGHALPAISAMTAGLAWSELHAYSPSGVAATHCGTLAVHALRCICRLAPLRPGEKVSFTRAEANYRKVTARLVNCPLRTDYLSVTPGAVKWLLPSASICSAGGSSRDRARPVQKSRHAGTR